MNTTNWVGSERQIAWAQKIATEWAATYRREAAKFSGEGRQNEIGREMAWKAEAVLRIRDARVLIDARQNETAAFQKALAAARVLP